MNDQISLVDIILYESYNSYVVRILAWISSDFLHTVSARYLIWKVSRKYRRYEKGLKVLNKKTKQERCFN